MELYILDKNFDRIFLVETYTDLVWTDRYCAFGDFELVCPFSPELLRYAVKDNYLQSTESEHLMIIETIELSTDVEKGYLIKLSGRSLESILRRRIIWGQHTYTGSHKQCAQNIILDHCINASIEARRIPKLRFDSIDNSQAQNKITVQFTGDNVYDSVVMLLSASELGFKIIPDYSTGDMVISIYSGANHSLYEENVVVTGTFDTGWMSQSWASEYHFGDRFVFISLTQDMADIQSNDKTRYPNFNWVYTNAYPMTGDRPDIEFDQNPENGYGTFVCDRDYVGFQIYTGVGDDGGFYQVFPDGWTSSNNYQTIYRRYDFKKDHKYSITFTVKHVAQRVGQNTFEHKLRIENFKIVDLTAINVTTNPVIFNEDFQNLLSSNYIESEIDFCNIALIGGEGEGTDRKYQTTNSDQSQTNNPLGLNRRELFVDARDISSQLDDGSGHMGSTEYANLLIRRGADKLAEHIVTGVYECELNPYGPWHINQDYRVGDIVQAQDGYGMDMKLRITEMVMTDGPDGLALIPSFEIL